MKRLDEDVYMFLAQLFHSLTRVLQWYGEYVWNFTTSDFMYESAIYFIYKVIVDDNYNH